MKKEEGEVKFDYNANQRGILKRTGSKISEFVMNMMAYGGITIGNGNIIVWGDPCLFIPLEAFTRFYYQLNKKLKDVDRIYYWLGKMTAKNAVITLIEKYGLDKSNLPEMVGSATQDGFGYLTLTEVDDNLKNLHGKIIGTNSTFSAKLEEIYGKQKNPADNYISGLLAGGAEGLFKKPILCIEEKCMAKGDLECFYNLKGINKEEKFDIFKGTSISEAELYEKTKKLVIGRKSSFKIFGKKDVKFGDGSFIYRGCSGVYFPTYTWTILEKLIREKIDKGTVSELMRGLAKDSFQEFINSIKNKEEIKYEPPLLQKLFSLLGLGEIDFKRINNNCILITSKNNPAAKEYYQLFGLSKEPVHIFLASLISEFFLRSLKKVEVRESTCMSSGKNVCSFIVTIKS